MIVLDQPLAARPSEATNSSTAGLVHRVHARDRRGRSDPIDAELAACQAPRPWSLPRGQRRDV